MADSKRPLSPHLQIYKPQITSVLSILHRLTGCALIFALPILSWFLYELAFGNLLESLFADVIFSRVGKFMLIGWTFCLAYHLCNGIRHLFWDMGWGFDLKHVVWSGWAAVIGSFLVTLLIWICVGSQGGL